MRLLVGFDGSEGGRDALELARTLCAETDGGATIATVLYGGPLPIDLAVVPDEQAGEAESLFDEAREALGELLAGTRAYAWASPSEILTSLSETGEFDAVAIGSPHRGPLGRVLIGNVGASLLNGAAHDVLVAPKGYAAERHEPLRTIAVGYDGAPEAKAALRRAEELARHSNATIRALTVDSAPVLVPGGGGYAAALPSPDPDEVSREAVESIDPKLGAERRCLSGSPANALVRECADGVDMLVLGSRGYGPLGRVLLGSVSRHVAQHAPCPVWVVPRPETYRSSGRRQ